MPSAAYGNPLITIRSGSPGACFANSEERGRERKEGKKERGKKKEKKKNGSRGNLTSTSQLSRPQSHHLHPSSQYYDTERPKRQGREKGEGKRKKGKKGKQVSVAT